MQQNKAEVLQYLTQAWRQVAQGNKIAAVFKTPEGRFLLAKEGLFGWNLPAAHGHGPRLDYLTPMACLAQHFAVPLAMQTMQFVTLIQGDERTIIVSFDLSAVPHHTPSDGRWVSLAELDGLKGLSHVVGQALLSLSSILATLPKEAEEVSQTQAEVPGTKTARRRKQTVQ